MFIVTHDLDYHVIYICFFQPISLRFSPSPKPHFPFEHLRKWRHKRNTNTVLRMVLCRWCCSRFDRFNNITRQFEDPDSCTLAFLSQTADSGIYRDIWRGIQRDSDNIVESGVEGVEKVQREKYAFMGEEVIAVRDCHVAVEWLFTFCGDVRRQDQRWVPGEQRLWLGVYWRRVLQSWFCVRGSGWLAPETTPRPSVSFDRTNIKFVLFLF